MASEGGAQRRSIRDVAETAFADMREGFGLPGVGWLVQHGAEVHAGAHGCRSQDAQENLVTVDDMWHLGSCSKALTTTVLAILFEDEGVPGFGWDTKVSSLVETHSDLADVTLEHLMQHRSGILTDLSADEEKEIVSRFPDSPREQRQAVLGRVLERAPEHPPNTRFHYSNVGYAILSALAERAVSKPWEEIVTERLIGPLGMVSLRFGGPRGETGSEPRGHNEAGEPEDHVDPPFHFASFAMSCKLHDYAKFARVHLKALRGEDVVELPLSRAAFARLYHTSSVEGYGEGEGYCAGAWRTIWNVEAHRPEDGTRLLFHWGTNFFYHAGVLVSSDHNLIAVACTNACTDMMARFATHMAFQALCDHIAASLLLLRTTE